MRLLPFLMLVPLAVGLPRLRNRYRSLPWTVNDAGTCTRRGGGAATPKSPTATAEPTRSTEK